jgi:predicted NUDIX family NTP pyrophosphohydrolase
MAAARSAGILLYRHGAGGPEVLLVHPGGPLWARRDAGAWSIPKGVLDEGEDAGACARREFQEELGSPPPAGPLLELGTIRQKGGKVVEAFALEGDLDATAMHSTTFTMEWPPRSGRQAEYPEVDRAAWVGADEAREKLIAAQAELLDRLLARLAAGEP